MNDTAPRIKKSIRLTPEEMKSLKKYRHGFHTEIDCAEEIGIGRVVLNRVLLIGSCSENTLIKIKKAIGV